MTNYDKESGTGWVVKNDEESVGAGYSEGKVCKTFHHWWKKSSQFDLRIRRPLVWALPYSIERQPHKVT